MPSILVGDIGGTKTDMALFNLTDRLLARGVYCNEDFVDFEAIIAFFIAGLPDAYSIDAACFGGAGPVTKPPFRLTNRNWEIHPSRVSEKLGGAPVYFMNDVAAMAYGLPTLSQRELLTVKAGVKTQGPKVIMSIGTGLGEALLVPANEKGWIVIPGEGGHKSFSPVTSEEAQLWQYLRGRGLEHVSWERVLSGNFGFEQIAHYLKSEDHYENDDADIANAWRSGSYGQAVTLAARKGRQYAAHCLELMVGLCGNEAGNLALASLATGGIYISGGVAEHIKDWLIESEDFRRAFQRKGRLSAQLTDIPVYLVQSDGLALQGLNYFARKMMGMPQ